MGINPTFLHFLYCVISINNLIVGSDNTIRGKVQGGKVMINNADRQFALGLPVPITGFDDNVPRLCYPYTLEKIENIYYYMSVIDCDDLYENFKDESKVSALALLLKESFQVSDEGFEVFVRTINNDNFKEIISDIKEVNGIEEADEEVQVNNNSNSLDFEKTAHMISIYTSTPLLDVKKLTLRQFKKSIEEISKVINWEYKISTISLAEKPSEHIQDNEHPLYCEPKVDKTRRMVTMKEIMGFASN